MNGDLKIKVMREISPEWDRLMRAAAAIEWGEARIVFNQGRPIRIDMAIKQIKLDDGEDFENGLKIIPLI